MNIRTALLFEFESYKDCKLNSRPEVSRQEASVDMANPSESDHQNREEPQAKPVRRTWLAMAILLLVVAVAGYLYLGGVGGLSGSAKPQLADTASTSVVAGPTKSVKALSEEQLERMLALASAQTRQDPKDASAWALVAHSYEMLGRFPESAKAYASLAQLLPGDAQVLADYADVLAVANGRSFQGEPQALLQRALSIDAKNAKALALMGSAYVEGRDYSQALMYLERARSASSDPTLLGQIEAGIVQARGLSSKPATAPASAPADVKQKAKSGEVGAAAKPLAQVSGRVWLAENLRARVPAQAALFLFARPEEGSRMPVALLRKKVSDLPLDFSLDDSMAMNPEINLSTQSKVVVVARISLRGNVIPQAGDLEGRTAAVLVGTKGLKLEITEVLK